MTRIVRHPVLWMAKLCALVGLDPDLVTEITIHARVGELPTVEARMFPVEMSDEVTEELKRWKVTMTEEELT